VGLCPSLVVDISTTSIDIPLYIPSHIRAHPSTHPVPDPATRDTVAIAFKSSVSLLLPSLQNFHFLAVSPLPLLTAAPSTIRLRLAYRRVHPRCTGSPSPPWRSPPPPPPSSASHAPSSSANAWTRSSIQGKTRLHTSTKSSAVYVFSTLLS
jgi:hypothetical protein